MGSWSNVEASNHRRKISRSHRHQPQCACRQLQKPQSSSAEETFDRIVGRLHLQSVDLFGRGHQEKEDDYLL